MRILSYVMCLLLVGTTISCACDKTEEETTANEDANSINITINDDEGGEATSVNINLDDIESDINDALNQVSESINITINEDGEKREATNFRVLKEVLPSRLLGMDRTSHTGEKTGAMGISVSQAHAKYSDDDRRADVSVVDGGSVGIASILGATWTTIEVDRETDNGYERTVEIDGFKAYEKWDERREKLEISWLYDDRYLITVEAYGVKERDGRRILNKLDVDELD